MPVKMDAKQKISLIQDIDDPKELKKTLRVKTNLLVIFAKSGERNISFTYIYMYFIIKVHVDNR